MMIAPSILASSYSCWEANGRSRRIPPEKRNARRFGSPMTTSAPSWARMMSSMPERRAVPGATWLSAARRGLSFRGSARIEPRFDRPSQRVGCLEANSATRLGFFRHDGFDDAELRALGQPSLGLRHRAQTTRQTDLSEAGDAGPDAPAARR